MSGKVFADTNVLLYLLSEQDPRNTRAAAIFGSRPTISTQVVNEFAVNCLRKAGKTREETAALALALLDCCDVQAVAESTVRLGLTLSTRYRLSIWDAMILASALEAGCEVLYSEDMQHQQLIEERLTIINPFVS
jgi:predicted nucleic acid-binding protein